ncbi:MAG: uncharacterized protein KVP18_000525 [Porospora cf. gigantea A]|uniref:uncharacterized protein n=1 Tax=Porospora cf. gigantea A TaxID=2853593 RepID=UPI00355A77BF|nr:MAG: hypothetical protein KVP18_000525 [Porospora cf. gigantea A]
MIAGRRPTGLPIGLRFQSEGAFISSVLSQVSRDLARDPAIVKEWRSLKTTSTVKGVESGWNLFASKVSLVEHTTQAVMRQLFAVAALGGRGLVSVLTAGGRRLPSGPNCLGPLLDRLDVQLQLRNYRSQQAFKRLERWRSEPHAGLVVEPNETATALVEMPESKLSFGLRKIKTPFLDRFFENPLVLNFLGDSVQSEALSAVAAVYPNFSLVDLYDDMRFVVIPRLLSAFLTKDMAELQRLCSPVACAALGPTVHEGQSLRRDAQLSKVKSVDLQGVVQSDNYGACFVFTAVVHQVHCFYDEDNQVVLGDPGNLHEIRYSFAVRPTPESAHYPWSIVEVSMLEDKKMLW